MDLYINDMHTSLSAEANHRRLNPRFLVADRWGINKKKKQIKNKSMISNQSFDR